MQAVLGLNVALRSARKTVQELQRLLKAELKGIRPGTVLHLETSINAWYPYVGLGHVGLPSSELTSGEVRLLVVRGPGGISRPSGLWAGEYWLEVDLLTEPGGQFAVPVDSLRTIEPATGDSRVR